MPSKLGETKTGRQDVCAPGQTAPGQAAPGQAAPGQTAPGQTAPGQAAPGQAAPGQTAPDESWRVFIAIELPASVRQKLKAHIGRLREAVPEASASWSREDNLHLTLKFLGDTPVSQIETLSQAAKRAATEVSSFELIIRGCGAFPPRGQPRVLWIGIEDPSGQLGRLQQALEDECAEAGFAREQRPFHPHLTTARLRKPHGSRQLAELHKEIGFETKTVAVSALVLVRSKLRSEGSRHSVISRHEFAQSNSD